MTIESLRSLKPKSSPLPLVGIIKCILDNSISLLSQSSLSNSSYTYLPNQLCLSNSSYTYLPNSIFLRNLSSCSSFKASCSK